MTAAQAKENLILMGLSAAEAATRAPSERIAYLKAASELLDNEDLATRCGVTARCIEEAENAQLRLFNSIRR